MVSTLMLHAGGLKATRDEVFAIPTRAATSSWFPVGHGTVRSKVESLLEAAGYTIARQELGLAREGARFFAMLDLESRIAEGVGLALGLRKSTDKSFPYGLAGGRAGQK